MRPGRWAAVAVGLALVSACGSREPLTVRVAVYQTQESLPYWAMRERGLDRAHGLRLEEVAVEAGAAAIRAIATGSADVGMPGIVPVLAAAERGIVPDAVIVAAANNMIDRDHPGPGLLAGPSVRRWKDLESQPIAVPAASSVNAATLKVRLEREGVRDYRLVEIGFANMGLAVAGGNVAAAAMSEPFMTQSLLRGDGRLLGYLVGEPPFEEMLFSVIAVRAAFYRARPESVTAFLRAHLAAVQWIARNSDEARAMLGRRTALGADVGRRVRLLRWAADAGIDAGALAVTQARLVEGGALAAVIPLDRLHDQTLLKAALAGRR